MYDNLLMEVFEEMAAIEITLYTNKYIAFVSVKLCKIFILDFFSTVM